jgi:hypothetical protein
MFFSAIAEYEREPVGSPARKAALRMGLTECIERAASPQALLSLPGLDLSTNQFLHATIGSDNVKVMAGGPGHPCNAGRDGLRIAGVARI